MNDKIVTTNSIINNFKLGEKVWFSLPKKSKIPGIIESDRIQSVGKQRDMFIDRGFEPFVPFTKISPDKISKRRKEFPGEINRIRLHHMGMEREYIDWKKKDLTTPDEDELLRLVKENYTIGAYESWYHDRKFSPDEIQKLVDRGLIHREKSSYKDNLILVPKGETYG